MLTEYKRDSDFIYYTDGSHSFIGQRCSYELQHQYEYFLEPTINIQDEKRVVEQINQVVAFNSATSFGYKSVNHELLNAINYSKTLSTDYGDMPKEMAEKWYSKMGNNKLLCDLFNWQVKNTAFGCPQMALAFSLSAIGGLLSGRFSLGNLTTNLYFTVAAPTSVGKTQTMNLMKALYKHSMQTDRIGGDIRSDGGFRNDLVKNKYKTFMIDEIGLFLQKINNPRAAESIKAINRSLLDGFTGFGDVHNVEASRADISAATTTLSRYAPQIFGVTTGETLWKNFSGEDAASGMLNRLIFLNAESSEILPKKEAEKDGLKKIPESFKSWFGIIDSRTKHKAGIMKLDGDDIDEFNLIDLRISDDAKAVFAGALRIEENHQLSRRKFCQIYARLTEITKKVSIIIELSENPSAFEISGGSAMLAFDLVKDCLDNSFKAANENITDSEIESLEKQAMNVINECGANGILLNELRRKSPFSGMKDKGNGMLAGLGVLGDVVFFIKKGVSGRPPKMAFGASFINDTFIPAAGWERLKGLN
ncbi:hypothetical protein AB6F95_004634 [Salmonella enterica]